MAKKKQLTLEEAIVKDEPYEVPENWIWSKLGSLLKTMTTKKPSNKNEFFQYIDIDAIDNKNQRVAEPKIIKVKEAPSRASREVLEGDVIFSTVRPYLRNIALITDEYKDCIASTGFYICRSNGVLISKYLYYLLCSEKSINYFTSMMKGDNSPSIRKEEFESLNIPVPPLKEQQRIVDKIESIFEKLDKSKELIEEARDGFEKRKFSIIYKGISGDLTGNKKKMIAHNSVMIPIHWKWIKFNDLGRLERGRSKHRPRNDERLFNGKYPFIQTGDIANSNGYIVEHKQTLSEFGLNQSKLFSKDTLCITIAANIGDVAILTYDCCFPDSVVGFTPNENVDSKYIYYFITLVKRDLEHFAPSTAQKNINLKILGNLEIPLPTLEEQKKIVRILDKLLEEESKIKELTQLEDQIELIKKSILAKAFRGELGTNSEEDESALELLKEILSKDI
ncbi:restriction endonuclease subunit S [Clostridium drakei]|nr:restriction endonuclease subunit S [Clostridium drakei]